MDEWEKAIIAIMVTCMIFMTGLASLIYLNKDSIAETNRQEKLRYEESQPKFRGEDGCQYYLAYGRSNKMKHYSKCNNVKCYNNKRFD